MWSCPLGHWHDPYGIGVGHHHQRSWSAPLYRWSCIPQGGCGDDDEESNTNNVRSDCRSHSPLMMLRGRNIVPTHVTTGMLKMCVSALKSTLKGFCLNLSKLRRPPQMRPLSYTSRCAQDDCDCQPPFGGGWEVRSIIPNLVGDNGLGQ